MAALRRRLLRWYATAHRPLPWRVAPGVTRHPDPYQVLVSEAMLQQTRVATVITYFQRFMAAFPTVAALAEAEQQSVLRLWQGLGYYRRARNLHAAARVIVADHGGRVPVDPALLRALPGVGVYTAGAIASIAHGLAVPAVDGNVSRVLARWFVLEEAVDQPAGRKRVHDLAAALVPADCPGDFNQALMELGATVCVPRQARCGECPVASLCEARRADAVARYPVLTARKKPQAVRHQVLAIFKGDSVVVQRRAVTGLWAGMWELPTEEVALLDGKGLERWAAARLGLRVGRVERVGSFLHQTTHRTITFEVFCCRWIGGRLSRGGGLWRGIGDVDDLPMSNAQRRAVGMLACRSRGA